MKKMNLNFLGLKMKMVLPLFLFIGLFLLSASTVNAQYMGTKKAEKAITEKLASLPPRTVSLRRKGQAMTPKMVRESVNELRYSFGKLMLRELKAGKTVAEAIDNTEKIALGRIPAGTSGISDYVETVKQEYVEFLLEE